MAVVGKRNCDNGSKREDCNDESDRNGSSKRGDSMSTVIEETTAAAIEDKYR